MAHVHYLVLADEADEAALWALPRLQRHLADEVVLATPADIAFAAELTYTWDGHVERSQIALGDGRVLSDEGLWGVLNRFTTVYAEHWRRLGPQDAAYAESEIHAALLVWLDSLGDVVTNPPSPFWLGGAYLRPQVWRMHAAGVGMPVAPVRDAAGTLATDVDTGSDEYVDSGLSQIVPSLTSMRTVIVHRGEVFGDATPALAAWGRALAERVGVPLLGMDVGQTADGAHVLADVTVHPDLRLGGQPLVESIARQWAGGGEP